MLRDLRRALLLVAEDLRPAPGRAAREADLLARLRRLQPHVLPAAPARAAGDAAPRLHLPRRRALGGVQPDLVDRLLRDGGRDPRLPRQRHPHADARARAPATTRGTRTRSSGTRPRRRRPGTSTTVPYVTSARPLWRPAPPAPGARCALATTPSARRRPPGRGCGSARSPAPPRRSSPSSRATVGLGHDAQPPLGARAAAARRGRRRGLALVPAAAARARSPRSSLFGAAAAVTVPGPPRRARGARARRLARLHRARLPRRARRAAAPGATT